MSVAYAVKLMGDALLFLCAASVFGRFTGQSGMLPAVPAACGLCALLAYWLRRRTGKPWARFAPLAGLLAMFVWARTPADWVLSGLAAAYAAWYVWKRPEAADYWDAHSRFMLGLKILPCVFALGALMGAWDSMRGWALPWGTAYLVAEILLLRMLRHDEATMNQTRFKLLNAAGVAAVCAAGALTASGLARRALAAAWDVLAHKLLNAVWMAVVYVFAGIGWLIEKIFEGMKGGGEELDLSGLERLDPSELAANSYGSGVKGELLLKILHYLLTAAAVAAVAAAVFFLFRALSRIERHTDENNMASAARERIPREPRQAARDNRQKVRNYYRKYLRLCQQRGYEREEWEDSGQIEENTRSLFPNGGPARLRQAYVRARYSSREVTQEDVRLARESYGRLKKNQE